MAKVWRSSKAQWFGCQYCDAMWLGGELPMNGKQLEAMHRENQFCLGCNRRTQFHGGFAIYTAALTYSGPASDIQHLLGKEAA